MEKEMSLDDALYVFLRRVEVVVSLEIGGKISTQEAYKDIKSEVRKLKKLKKQITHEQAVIDAALDATNVLQLRSPDEWNS